MNSKICVIGGGRWGSNHIRTLDMLGALAGIVENNSKRAEELKSEYPSVKCFNDVTDAVTHGFDGFVVATPAETHFMLGKYLLENKIPVLIEKPITTKLEDAIELNNIARENKVNLMVGHVLLFHPAFIKIKQMLDNGDLGNCNISIVTGLTWELFEPKRMCSGVLPPMILHYSSILLVQFHYKLHQMAVMFYSLGFMIQQLPLLNIQII